MRSTSSRAGRHGLASLREAHVQLLWEERRTVERAALAVNRAGSAGLNAAANRGTKLHLLERIIWVANVERLEKW
jgi:hypothetical protein